MTDSVNTTALSGRDLARARRREMSHTGAAKIKKSSSGQQFRSKPPTPVTNQNIVSSSVQAVNTGASANVTTPLTGKAFSMARRLMLSKTGKKTLPVSVVNTGRGRGTSVAPSVDNAQSSNVLEKEAVLLTEPCCDACADSSSDQPYAGDTVQAKDDATIDNLCDIIQSDSQTTSSSVRAFCRARRKNLSQKGKVALPGKVGFQARKTLANSANSSALTGRVLAKLQREARCANGRGDTQACRPSGRVRPTNAPDKVELGTTLSGQPISGTQVEQTNKVTGSEAGTCRAITGTEYLGVEQFSHLCSATPQPAQAKVAVSETTQGQLMTGSNVAISNTVTGTESGDCKSVTGSEYLGVEHFKSVCSSTTAVNSIQKVMAGRTSKDIVVTGVDEARDNAVTGSESGSAQNVTGSDYINMQPKSRSATAPNKVEVSHTGIGIAVSGGESENKAVTGSDQGACGRVTGSEYISSERFVSTCGTKPMPTPAKVGVDTSRAGMTITGNLLDRNENMTGNEPGTCQRVTGSQNNGSASKNLCDQRSAKVQEMHTAHGQVLTGTEVSNSPKLTGDKQGSCKLVTGSEYVSQESFKQSCTQTPTATTPKTGVSHTWNNQLVSGAQTGHSDKITGVEQGVCKTLTGSSYTSREQVSEFCDASTLSQGETHLQHNQASQNVSGRVPTMDKRFSGSFDRGSSQHVSGSSYQTGAIRKTSNAHHLVRADLVQSSAIVENKASAYQSDFSVTPPAKLAGQQQDRQAVHSSVVLGVNSAITGSINKAQGVISGTPEFRHQQDEVATPIMEVATELKHKITGEGNESGFNITGNDWSRGNSVTGTEGMFSARRNQTQRGTEVVEHNKIGAHALKDRQPIERVDVSRVTGAAGGISNFATVTLSGGATG